MFFHHVIISIEVNISLHHWVPLHRAGIGTHVLAHLHLSFKISTKRMNSARLLGTPAQSRYWYTCPCTFTSIIQYFNQKDEECKVIGYHCTEQVLVHMSLHIYIYHSRFQPKGWRVQGYWVPLHRAGIGTHVLAHLHLSFKISTKRMKSARLLGTAAQSRYWYTCPCTFTFIIQDFNQKDEMCKVIGYRCTEQVLVHMSLHIYIYHSRFQPKGWRVQGYWVPLHRAGIGTHVLAHLHLSFKISTKRMKSARLLGTAAQSRYGYTCPCTFTFIIQDFNQKDEECKVIGYRCTEQVLVHVSLHIYIYHSRFHPKGWRVQGYWVPLHRAGIGTHVLAHLHLSFKISTKRMKSARLLGTAAQSRYW